MTGKHLPDLIIEGGPYALVDSIPQWWWRTVPADLNAVRDELIELRRRAEAAERLLRADRSRPAMSSEQITDVVEQALGDWLGDHGLHRELAESLTESWLKDRRRAVGQEVTASNAKSSQPPNPDPANINPTAGRPTTGQHHPPQTRSGEHTNPARPAREDHNARTHPPRGPSSSHPRHQSRNPQPTPDRPRPRHQPSQRREHRQRSRAAERL